MICINVKQMDVDNISGYKLFLGGNADAIFFFL